MNLFLVATIVRSSTTCVVLLYIYQSFRLTHPCASHVPTVPDAPKKPCPGGIGKLVANDANDWKTSYTHKPNRILRATAESLILENHSIMTIMPLDPKNESDPVAIGMNTSAFISVGEYMVVC